MNDLAELQEVDGVAVLLVNNPPVNALSAGVPEAIAAAIRSAEANSNAHAIVLMGAGKTFIAGADIKQLEDMAWGRGAGAPNLHNLLLQIEDCAKPVVMAIHGTALGGGLEVAMAGHYRVAVPSAQLGQPEVNLGIIPGAEGTQRLPRLAGVEKALEMCVTGKPLMAAAALEAGLLDSILEGDLRSQAVKFANRISEEGGPHPKTRERAAALKSASTLDAALAKARELAAKSKKNMLAPLKAIEAIAAAATLPFAEGCARERALFQECVTSDQCRALIHAFFAERGAGKVPGVAKEPPALPIERIGILGAGTMGGGIAMACVNVGIPVLLKDSNQQSLDAGMAAIRKNYDVSVQRGRFTPEMVAERIARIHPQLDYSGFDSLDLVIEAVFENSELKRKVFSELTAITKPQAILASNTSTLNIDEFAAATLHPENVLGLHFFSPANVMRLLEIVRTKSSASQTVAAALAFAKRISKVGVVVGNCPGFVGNRMMFPYMYEAQFLVEEGATPEQVDLALARFGMAMGIFEVDDMAGLDVAWRIRKELRHFSEPGARRPLVADQLCEMDRFGQKTGKGWYAYGQDRKPNPDPEVLALIRDSARKAGIPQREFSDQEIVERALYGLINEGARLLEEGFALRAADIDVIYLNGYGFPSWRGGPMFYADTVGLTRILDRIQQFQREHGSRWTPANLLRNLAEANRTFREYDAEHTG
ncbi:MAG TPA: 3-hydroxyacyl-CoA dehydrogenase NAD-binding domain-containing protein [Candidatus Limnocylindrales bacterium]|nr:3-hydroxyacyl-CoA dehydrogenase NAD-binding domain-containing protein [Candidatus Limnocylindrales bacterium]